MGEKGPQDISSEEIFAGKKVVLFAVPGAFTPGCTVTHLPGYVVQADKIKAKGVDSIVCVAVNDAFVMDAWAKATGGKVIGGSINGEGSLTIEVKGTGKDSFLSQVIDLVKQAQESKSRTQDLANTAAMWLTIVALGGGVLTFAIWQVLTGKDRGAKGNVTRPTSRDADEEL